MSLKVKIKQIKSRYEFKIYRTRILTAEDVVQTIKIKNVQLLTNLVLIAK